MPVLVKINFSTVMEDKEKKNVVSAGDNLTDYMETVIADLEKEGKFPAAHVYRSVLRSFTRFWNASAPMRDDPTSMSNALTPIRDVFTPERLKEYETWLTECECSPNTISTYMRTLQAVYNRWMPPGMVNHNPILFKELYTKVESRTKRAHATVRNYRILCVVATATACTCLLHADVHASRYAFHRPGTFAETELARQAYCLPASQDR